MIDEAEGATGPSLLLQVLLQEFAGDGLNVERPEIRDEVFADAVPGSGRGGELPFPAGWREKHVANPFRHGPGAAARLPGMEVNGLEQMIGDPTAARRRDAVARVGSTPGGIRRPDGGFRSGSDRSRRSADADRSGITIPG
jgi:hypothetical protein